jgi:Rps23 Pro-64 3,4-dihydroxylase Tpa1-like proline 4-hydroxylase
MELVKKQLEENGYAYFNMQDYDIFLDDYEYYSKYKCNQTNNLKENIKGIRVDAVAKPEFRNEFANGKLQIQKDFSNWEEAKIAMDDAKNKMSLDKHSFQRWYFGHDNNVNTEFKSLTSKVVKHIYDLNPNELGHNSSITYYEPGCFLRRHQDGYSGGRLCVVLVYLNDTDYKPEWGGNLVFNNSFTIEPIYGNIAILDFKSHNAFHEVKEVTDGYGRYAFLDFIDIKDTN